MLDRDQISPESVRPLRRSEYDRLVQWGVFGDEQLELLYGTIVAMSPIGTAHAESVRRLLRLFSSLIDRVEVQIQLPLAASHESEPQPDVSLVPRGDYLADHPSKALLVIEVADTSLKKDRLVKAPLYASAGIPEYWIVNLIDDVIEVHRSPSRGKYREVTRHGRGEVLRPLQFADLAVRVDDDLPPRK